MIVAMLKRAIDAGLQNRGAQNNAEAPKAAPKSLRMSNLDELSTVNQESELSDSNYSTQ